MNRHLLRCIVLFCLLCACLLISVMSYADIDQAFAKKDFTTEWGSCPECQCSGFMFHYYDVEYDYTKNADGLTHNVSLCDKIVCESPLHNVPYEIHKFNYRAGPDRPHSKNVNHIAGDQVDVRCSKCSFHVQLSHEAYAKTYGTFISKQSVYTYLNSTSHRHSIYDIYQCNIPGCTRTANKPVYDTTCPHHYRTVSRQVTGHVYEYWQQCSECYHKKNKHTELR